MGLGFHPANRVGSAWQQGASVWSWVVSALLGVFRRPRGFWDRVMVDRRAARGLAVVNAATAGVVGVGIPAYMLRDVMLFVVFAPLAGVTVWVLTLIEHAGLRFWGRVHGARITKDVAWAVCGHASYGWVIGGVLVAAGWIVGMFDRASGYFHIGQSGRVAVLPFGSWLYMVIGAFVGLLLFETLTYLGVRRMRFANRPSGGDQPVGTERGGEAAERPFRGS